MEEKSNEKLLYNNEIANLRKLTETITNQLLQEECIIDEKTELNRAKTLEFSQIKMACENIYRHILEYSKQKYKKVDTLQQVVLIGSFLQDYMDIMDIKSIMAPLPVVNSHFHSDKT